MTDLNVANIGLCLNSWDWVFRMSMMSKKQSTINKQKRAVSADSALLEHMLIQLYLQNWAPGLEVFYSFLINGSTWYVHLKVFARCVNSILYLHKKYQKCDAKVWTYHCYTYIEYMYLNQSCTDSFVLISSNIMGNIRNEVDKTFVRTKQIDSLTCKHQYQVSWGDM